MINKTPLFYGISAVILGIALLILAKFMLTNFVPSITQAHRSNIVRYVALFILTFGLFSIIYYFVRVADAHMNKEN